MPFLAIFRRFKRKTHLHSTGGRGILIQNCEKPQEVWQYNPTSLRETAGFVAISCGNKPQQAQQSATPCCGVAVLRFCTIDQPH